MIVTVCPMCRLIQTIVVLCVLHGMSTSFTTNDLYRSYRNRAISEHEKNMRHRNRVLSINDVNASYLPSNPSWLTEQPLQCPVLNNLLSDTPLRMCPGSLVTDFDENRRPMIIFQVKCRCLHCPRMWFGGYSKLCQPLFQFMKVDRVIDVKDNGDKVYAKVWEPVSYACACRKKPGRRRHVMSP